MKNLKKKHVKGAKIFLKKKTEGQKKRIKKDVKMLLKKKGSRKI